MINKVRKETSNVLLLNGGDTYIAGKKHAQLAGEIMIKAYRLMQYDALNAADGELTFGIDFFNKMTRQPGNTFLSCNMTFGKAEKPVIMPYIIKEFEGVRVAVTGIVAPVFFKEKQMEKEAITVENPVDALKKILPELRQKADVIVLLSHMTYSGTVNLIQYNDLQGVDIAIAGHGINTMDKQEKVKDTWIVQNSERGEYLGRLDLSISADKKIQDCKDQLIALTDAFPDDPAALKLMEEFSAAQLEERKKEDAEQTRQRNIKEKTALLHMTPAEFVKYAAQKKANKKAIQQFPPPTK